MRARDGDGLGAIRERREHLCAWPDGDAQFTSAYDLRIGLGDGRGDDHDVGRDLVDGPCRMADIHLDASLLEVAHIARRLEVGTRHGIATLMEHERDAAHARTTDADEVCALEVLRGGDGHDGGILPKSMAT